MPGVTDAVLAALSARDLEAFVACYAEDAQIEDGHGLILAAGHEALRARYAPMFERFPTLRVRKLGALAVGSFVVQEEEVTGRKPEPERHIAVYRLSNGLIAHERLLR